MSDSKVREQFEAWTIRAGGHPSVLRRNAQGDYALGSVRAEYAVWQASRAAALAEAKKACDDEAAEWDAQVEAAGKLSSITRHAVESTAVGAMRCARRIRALAGRGV